MKRLSKTGVTLGFLLALVVVAAGCSGSSEGLKGVVITEENRAEIADRLTKELSYEEVNLLKAYFERSGKSLQGGTLPAGLTLGQMISDQRAWQGEQAAAPEETTASSGSTTDQAAPPEPSSGAEPTKPSSGQRESGRPPSGSSQTAEDRQADAARTPPPPATAVLLSGSVLRVRLLESLSSKSNSSGDSFRAELDQPLRVNGNLVAPAGSRVVGRLSDVKESGKVKGRAQMTLTLESLTVGGDEYRLNSSDISAQAEGTKKRDAKRIGIATGVGAAIGAIAGGGKGAAIGSAIGGGAGAGVTLMTAGEEVEFAVEQLFEFELRNDLKMKIIRDRE